MKLSLLALALGAVACDDGSDEDPVADMGTSTEEGETVFAQQCASCHAADGSGSTLGPDIRNPADWDYNAYVVRNGRDEIDLYAGAMPAYGADLIDDGVLDQIWSWLGTAAKPGDGAGLFARYCANCHGEDGSGGRAEHTVAIDEAEIRAIVRGGNGGSEYGAATEFMPAFDTELITDAELDLLVGHIGTL